MSSHQHLREAAERMEEQFTWDQENEPHDHNTDLARPGYFRALANAYMPVDERIFPTDNFAPRTDDDYTAMVNTSGHSLMVLHDHLRGELIADLQWTGAPPSMAPIAEVVGETQYDPDLRYYERAGGASRYQSHWTLDAIVQNLYDAGLAFRPADDVHEQVRMQVSLGETVE
jgi:hypothetical protein